MRSDPASRRERISAWRRWYWRAYENYSRARSSPRDFAVANPVAALTRYLAALASARWPAPRALPGRQTLAIFAWQFPPAVTGGVYRTAAFARHASGAGWRPTVIAGPPPAEPSTAGQYLRRRVPPAVRVHEVAEPRAYWALPPGFPSVDGGFMTAIDSYLEARAVLDAEPPAVVMASGPPFHSFVAAYLAARRYRAPLVLVYRDEWTECPFPFVECGNADWRWQKRCLGAADLVIFTTESQRRHLERRLELTGDETWQVVPNGWDPDDAPRALDGEPPVARGPLTLTFAGALGDHTLPGAFLDTLAETLAKAPSLRPDLRIRFVGQKCDAATAQLRSFPFPDLLDCVDLVPKPEAGRAMRDAHGLLVFNSPAFERYLPGKLYEYIASTTPVLVYGEGGEIHSLVARLGAGLIVPSGDPKSLREAIERLRSWDRQAGRRVREEWLAGHTRDVLAGRVLRLFERLVR